jgi:hypothetical protein
LSFWDRLDKYIRGGPGTFNKPFALLPQREVGQQVADALSGLLSGHGFLSVGGGKRRWARPYAPQILGLVELQAVKSDFTAIWGLSLGFVPHLTTKGEITWHRTPKSAVFDLSYQPFDYEQDLRPWAVSCFSTREELPGDSRLFASRVSESAARFLEPLTSLRPVLEAFEAKRTRPYIRLGFDHYPQEMLAYTFVLSRAGEERRSKEALKRFAEQHQVPAATEGRLLSLLAEVRVAP